MYKVKFYKGWYKSRQLKATQDKACIYIEQHLNSVESCKPNYCMTLVKKGCNDQTKMFAAKYCDCVVKRLGIPLYNKTGIKGVISSDRGYGNLAYSKMTALLLEPFFLSSEEMQALITTDWLWVKVQLVEALYETIKVFFPDGGLIALSVGHKYKPKPSHRDRGAVSIVEVEKKNSWWRRLIYRLPKYIRSKVVLKEADLCEEILIMLRDKLLTESK